MKKEFETPKVVELGTLQQFVLSGTATHAITDATLPHSSLIMS